MAGAGFSNLIYYFQQYGLLDFLLPFILVFTIVFAVLQKTKIIGEGKKNFNVIIALVMAILFVVPHITGSYGALGYDPVRVMNESLPSIGLLIVAVVMILIMLGIFGAEFVEGGVSIVAFIAIIFVVYIFGASLGFWRAPHDIFYWWGSDLTELLIIILIFGLVVYFITKEDKSTESGLDNLLKTAGKFIGKVKSK